LKPGKTTRVDLRRTGRSVKGLLIPTLENGGEAVWTHGQIRLENVIPVRNIVDSIFYTWGRTMNDPEALEKEPLPAPSYGAQLPPGGEFSIPDVPPGHYKLDFWLSNNLAEEGEDADWTFGARKDNLYVPATDTDEPLDLGLLEIAVEEEEED
jgi:hypothetical protein